MLRRRTALLAATSFCLSSTLDAASLDTSTLRTLIRPDSYIRPNGPAAAAVVVMRDRVPEGMVGLLYIRDPGSTRPAKEADLDHLDPAEACATGLRNLAAALGPTDLAVHPLLPRAIGRLQDGPDVASRLLLHADWTRASARFGGHLLVAAPTLDELLYADAASPGARDALLAMARERFVGAPRPLSSSVYEWRPEGWAVVAR